MKPFKSAFKSGGTDTQISLSTGTKVITGVLIKPLSSNETDMIIINSSMAPDKSGTISIDDEIIYYHGCHKDEPGTLFDLLRGQEGTVATEHAIGTAVSIHGAARHGNPAIVDSMIAMQEKIIDLEMRLVKLEKKP